MSLLSNIYVAQSGLRAASTAIQATSQNVTNASTKGFSRRSVQTSTAPPIRRAGVWFGQGVNTDRISRSSDNILQSRRFESAGTSSAADATATALSRVESLFGDNAPTNVRIALDGFFDSMTAATVDPSDRALRRGVASAGERLAFSVSQTASGLESAQVDIGRDIKSTLPDINGKLKEIATLNKALAGAGGALSAGDLADQRDVLIRDLSESIGATAYLDGAGAATVLIGGHAVVEGINARTLSFSQGPAGPEVSVSNDQGRLNVTGIVAGRVGGLIDANDQITGYLNQLNTFAADFSTAANTQHQAGFDQNGAAGATLFSVTPGSEAKTFAFDLNYQSNPETLALAGATSATAGDGDNLTALMALQNSPIITGGKSPVDFATNLTADVGGDVATAKALATHQTAVTNDLDQLYESLNGVDLDEEAANLMNYQTAYQAAAKVVRSTDQMLSTLMELV